MKVYWKKYNRYNDHVLTQFEIAMSMKEVPGVTFDRLAILLIETTPTSTILYRRKYFDRQYLKHQFNIIIG